MKRLSKLDDDQLLRLEIAVLELEPASPSRDQQLRFALDWERLRAIPKPKRGGKVPRLRDPPKPGHRATLHEQPRELPAIAPSPNMQPTPTAFVPGSASPPPPAAPPPPKPNSNVIFASRFFHAGRSSPRWIGGEV